MRRTGFCGKKLVSAALVCCMFMGSTGTTVRAVDDVMGKVSDAFSGVETMLEDAADTASDALGEAGDAVSGKAQEAGEFAAQYIELARDKAGDVRKSLSDAGVSLKIKASELGNATSEKAYALLEKAGMTADKAVSALEEAGGMVIDSVGNVADAAAMTYDNASETVTAALAEIEERGAALMELAEKTIADIDLGDEDDLFRARRLIRLAVRKAYENGMFPGSLTLPAIRVVADIVAEAAVDGYLFKRGDITLSEYAYRVSKTIVKEGLPVGVGYLAKKLPIPGSEMIADAAMTYMIAKIYEEEEYEKEETSPESLTESVPTESFTEDVLTESAPA